MWCLTATTKTMAGDSDSDDWGSDEGDLEEQHSAEEASDEESQSSDQGQEEEEAGEEVGGEEDDDEPSTEEQLEQRRQANVKALLSGRWDACHDARQGLEW